MNNHTRIALEKELDKLHDFNVILESQKESTNKIIAQYRSHIQQCEDRLVSFENKLRDYKAKIDDIELDLGIVSVVLSETNPLFPKERFYGLTVVLEQYSVITLLGLEKRNVTILVTIDNLEHIQNENIIVINNEYAVDYDICMELLVEEYNKANT